MRQSCLHLSAAFLFVLCTACATGGSDGALPRGVSAMEAERECLQLLRGRPEFPTAGTPLMRTQPRADGGMRVLTSYRLGGGLLGEGRRYEAVCEVSPQGDVTEAAIRPLP